MFIRKILSTTAPALLALSTSFAVAQDISYNYAEIRYLDSEIYNSDGDGIEIAGSYQFDVEWLVSGSYSSQDFDFNQELDVIEIGVGYMLPEVSGFDLVGSASIIDADYANGGDNGFRLALSARSMLTDEFEGRASLNYLDINDSDLFIEVGADYFFRPELSAGLEIQLGSDTDTISIGARWYYDR